MVESICDGEGYPVGDSIYTEAGVYVTELTSQYGCDSVVILDLSVITVFTFNINAVICEGESYFAGGVYQTVSGVFYDTLIGGNGCPQYLVTHLVVNPTYTDTLHISICAGENYFVSGENQTATGFYSDTLLTVNNCDSIIVTDLLVLPTHLDTMIVNICEGESYFAGGTMQTAPGTYTDTYANIYNCDSIVVTGSRCNLKSIQCYGIDDLQRG